MTNRGILEFTNRRGRQTLNLCVGKKFDGLPSYLGVLLNNKFSAHAHLNWINKKFNPIAAKISPVLWNVSVAYNFNLWQVFVRPLLDPLALFAAFEKGKTLVIELERFFRRTIKRFLGAGLTTPSSTLEYLTGYRSKDRSFNILKDSAMRWSLRKRNERPVGT